MEKVLKDSAAGKKDGLKNLEFLKEFMVSQGLSQSKAASLMGYTRHAIIRWFRNDDAQISVLQEFFQCCGYDLVLSFKKPHENPNVKVSFPDAPSTSTKRLAFLRNALRLAGLNRAEASKLLGMSVSGISYWMRVDDCSISRLFELAEKTGLILNIEIKKI